jgi:hypothetical protein
VFPGVNLPVLPGARAGEPSIDLFRTDLSLKPASPVGWLPFANVGTPLVVLVLMPVVRLGIPPVLFGRTCAGSVRAERSTHNIITLNTQALVCPQTNLIRYGAWVVIDRV